MNAMRVKWEEVGSLTGNELKKKVFSIIQAVSIRVNNEFEDPEVMEAVPRLSDLIGSREELVSFKETLSALARAIGLWNYIDKDNADYSDALLAEAVTAPELNGIVLHREQIAALNELLAGRNLILSAPTSFGKSLLIDALLASGNYSRVAIVLPTIALLDEFRRRLRRRFSGKFNVVMHPNDKSSSEEPTIFLGTQERLINRPDLGALDLTVVDEFINLALSDVMREALRSTRQYINYLEGLGSSFSLAPILMGFKSLQVGAGSLSSFELDFQQLLLIRTTLKALKTKSRSSSKRLCMKKIGPH